MARLLLALALLAPAALAQGSARPHVEHLTGAGVLPTEPALPFSDAVRVGDTVLLSGMVGLRPGTLELVPGGIEAEARQTMANIAATLQAHGLTLADVVKRTVMIEDIAEWGAFNAVYETFFDAPYPARSAFGADGLALGAAVEVECIAAARAPGLGEAARVLAAEDAYVQAEIDADEAALRRLVDDRFVLNNVNGTTADKEALIETVLGFGMTGQTITERSVVVDGPTAVVTGTAELRFASDGGPDRAQTLRYTAVYVDRGGVWRLLALHMSPRAPSR